MTYTQRLPKWVTEPYYFLKCAFGLVFMGIDIIGGFLYLLFRTPVVFIRRQFAKPGAIKIGEAETIVQPVIIETDLTEIKLSTFVKCYEDDELHLLTKSGKPNIEELQRAWKKVLGKYYELAGIVSPYYLQAKQTYIRLEAEVIMITGLCETLKLNYTEEVAACLRDYTAGGTMLNSGYPFTPESYLNDVARTLTGLKRLTSIKNAKGRELEAMAGKGGEAKKSFVMDNLFEIRKYEQLNQSPTELIKTLSLADYALYLKRFREHTEAVKAEAAKQGVKKK